MFGNLFRRAARVKIWAAAETVCVGGFIEPLEDRQFLSASHFGGAMGHGNNGFGGLGGGQVSAIQFSLAPTAVQTGLDTLATSDGLNDPTSAQAVTLGNRNGVETYNMTFNGTGTVTTLTVDQNGNPVSASTRTTTTFGELTTSDSAAASEISAIATALNLAAPATDSAVIVTTTSDGSVTYSISLSADSSTTTPTHHRPHDTAVSVDMAGNPVGNQNLPFSVIPAPIQTALNANAPTGAAALASDSTQNTSVRTIDGVTTYTVAFMSSGTTTYVTVDVNGKLTSLPAHTTTTFGELPAAAQTELQALATANHVSTAITNDQSVDVLTEANGTVIYSIKVKPDNATNGRRPSRPIVISVDAMGNPTVLPADGAHDDDDDGDGEGFGGPGGPRGRGCDDGGGESSVHSGNRGNATSSTHTTNTITSVSSTAAISSTLLSPKSKAKTKTKVKSVKHKSPKKSRK